MRVEPGSLDERIKALKILVIDDEPYIRKVIRTLLTSIGVRSVCEAADGIEGLESIRTNAPDIVLVDWEMPLLDGPEFVRLVRSPGSFPMPNIPIVMLTGHAERSRVVAALKAGVHEYLLKPVSSQALRTRIASILNNPRPMVRMGSYYGPTPRKPSTCKPDTGYSDLVLVN